MATRPIVHRARRLRRMMTLVERRLWWHLAELPPAQGHFRRQAPIGPYVVDFANHSVRVVIEVDGDQHGRPQGRRSDQARDQWLRSQGYRVLRFWNGDVVGNIEGVMSEIMRQLPDGTPPPPPPPTPPHKGEGSTSASAPSSPSPSMGEGRGGGDAGGGGDTSSGDAHA